MTTVGTSVQRLRLQSWRIAQVAVGAALAWWLASELLQHSVPFLAPIAAIVGIGTAEGRHLRRVVEIVGGVAVGVLVGDLLVSWVGTGVWQVGLAVAAAAAVAVLLDGSPLVVTQACVNAVIVTTLLPDPSAGLSRWLDAVVGGTVAVVAVALSPLVSYRAGRDRAAGVLGTVAAALRAAARAMVEHDIEAADAALVALRDTEPALESLRTAVAEGQEVVRASPLRRRHRADVQRYVDLLVPLDRAVRNIRVLARRVVVALQDDEPVPAGHAGLVDGLADAVDQLAGDLREGTLPKRARQALIERAAASADPSVLGGGLSAQVVIAQLRSAVVDLLQVTGLRLPEAVDAVPRIPAPGSGPHTDS
jgi:uncharacterized membrane protein YgaE (UPF0421/DUF939 family)